MLKPKTVGILLFNEVEVMDFAGPFEVFSLAVDQKYNKQIFKVSTISQSKNIIKARNGLQIQPDYDFHQNPHFDILIIPGGYGAEEIEIHNDILLKWIKDKIHDCKIIASVCTGAFLLAEAGILDGKHATTHWMDTDRLEREYTKISVQRNVKFVDEDKIITSGGISAGINMSFFIIKKLLGEEIAITTAKRMEYDINIHDL